MVHKITIEVERVNNTTNNRIVYGDKIIYKSETSSMFDIIDHNLLKIIRNLIIELDTNDNLSEVDYPDVIIS